MNLRFQRLTSFALAVALAAPLSLFAESRTPRRTSDLERMAADLERVLRRGKVAVEGRRSPAADRSTASETEPSIHNAIVDAMNRERTARGLRPLRINSTLSLAASDRVDDMLGKRYFDHVAPDGTQPFVWATKRGYAYRIIGENLATGYRSAGSVVDGWMHSPGHRANILTREYDEVGIAVAGSSPVRGYSGPLVVAMYGAR